MTTVDIRLTDPTLEYFFVQHPYKERLDYFHQTLTSSLVATVFGLNLPFLEGMEISHQLDFDECQLLLPFIPMMANTMTTARTEHRRAYILTDRAIRIVSPIALRWWNLESEAKALESLDPITNEETASVAYRQVDEAMEPLRSYADQHPGKSHLAFMALREARFSAGCVSDTDYYWTGRGAVRQVSYAICAAPDAIARIAVVEAAVASFAQIVHRLDV